MGMDLTLDLATRRLNRRMFLKLCLPVILAACSAPRGETPTAEPPATTHLPTLVPTQAPAIEATVPAVATVPATEVPAAVAPTLPPTPACGDEDDEVTLAQTEGPFFTPNSPERTSLLETGLAGTPMTLTGLVLNTRCLPVAGALVDFWHADDAGIYDNTGYKLRGHQFTDDQGRYTLETIVPGLYTGRTRHFHVKVQAANQPVLTTQLYFPDEPANASDGIFSPELLMEIEDADGMQSARFNFVLEVA
jgi:protocatechuate 3,4-dioxygenase beta subunit